MEKMFKTYSTVRSANPLVLILVVLGVLFAAFWILKYVVFKILYTLAPFLFALALILNYRVVLGYGKWVMDLFKSSILTGILASVLSVVGYPFVSAFLAFRAYQLRGETWRKNDETKEGEYIKYREVEEDFLDISEEKRKGEEFKDQYKDMF
jgi:hypothetical protein